MWQRRISKLENNAASCEFELPGKSVHEKDHQVKMERLFYTENCTLLQMVIIVGYTSSATGHGSSDLSSAAKLSTGLLAIAWPVILHRKFLVCRSSPLVRSSHQINVVIRSSVWRSDAVTADHS